MYSFTFVLYRFRQVDPNSNSFTLWKLGSKFRYSGRTQQETKVMAASTDREAPYFDRVHSKRATYHGHTPKRSLERGGWKTSPWLMILLITEAILWHAHGSHTYFSKAIKNHFWSLAGEFIPCFYDKFYYKVSSFVVDSNCWEREPDI